MLFAELIPQEARDLGSLGVSGLMGVGLFVFAGVIVWLVRTWRSDMEKMERRLSDQQAKHDQEKKEQRGEYMVGLREISDTVKAVGAEARANTQALQALAMETKANTTTILARLDRLETHLPTG